MALVYKLGVLGDVGVGKTALISQFIFKKFVAQYDPTIEDSYTIDKRIGSKVFKLEILDTSGADQYQECRSGWIGSSEGFILVYSISSKSSFLRIQELYKEIQQVKKSQHPYISLVPIMIVGNKVDIAERVVSLQEGKKLARILGSRFIEVSAKDGGNIEDCFCSMVDPLQTLRMKQTLLGDLVNSLPEWRGLLTSLKVAMLSSRTQLAEVSMTARVPAHTTPAATEQPDQEIPSHPPLFHTAQHKRSIMGITLPNFKFPLIAKRQRSFLNINGYQQSSRPPSLVLEPKASSIGWDISQPSSGHPSSSVLEGSYDSKVQTALKDIIKFLNTFSRDIRRIDGKAKLTKIMARFEIDVEDDSSSVKFDYSVGRHDEEPPAVEEVDEIDMVQKVKQALLKCQTLCEDVAFEVMKGDGRKKIMQMEDEFEKMIKAINKV